MMQREGPPRVVVVDGVYPNVDQVREIALAGEFTRTGNYPGMRSPPAAAGDWEACRRVMVHHLGEHEVRCWGEWDGEDKSHTCFQLCLEGARTWVHHDADRWVAIVHLTPEPVYRAAEGRCGQRHGTALYLRRAGRGAQGTDHDWRNGPEAQSWNESASDPDDWEEHMVIAGRYNRLIAFDGRYYHRSILPGFGDRPATGRLTQVFFWS